MRLSRSILAGLWLACVACSSPREQQQVARTTAPASKAAPEPAAEQPPAPETPPEPPDVQLKVLRERLDVGLAIQNRAQGVQRFRPRVQLVPEGEGKAAATLRLRKGEECIALRPGSEWLWPRDWGLSLAPDQSAFEGLSGRYQFMLEGCEGGTLRSASVSLPSRMTDRTGYFGAAASGTTK